MVLVEVVLTDAVGIGEAVTTAMLGIMLTLELGVHLIGATPPRVKWRAVRAFAAHRCSAIEEDPAVGCNLLTRSLTPQNAHVVREGLPRLYVVMGGDPVGAER